MINWAQIILENTKSTPRIADFCRRVCSVLLMGRGEDKIKLLYDLGITGG